MSIIRHCFNVIKIALYQQSKPAQILTTARTEDALFYMTRKHVSAIKDTKRTSKQAYVLVRI